MEDHANLLFIVLILSNVYEGTINGYGSSLYSRKSSDRQKSKQLQTEKEEIDKGILSWSETKEQEYMNSLQTKKEFCVCVVSASVFCMFRTVPSHVSSLFLISFNSSFTSPLFALIYYFLSFNFSCLRLLN